jgi:hypothetical protein
MIGNTWLEVGGGHLLVLVVWFGWVGWVGITAVGWIVAKGLDSRD